MTEFKMELMVRIDTDDVLEAEEVVAEELLEAKDHPESGINGFYVGDTINMEVFNDE